MSVGATQQATDALRLSVLSGLKMQMSTELLMLEIGLSCQSFQESNKRYSKWVTAGWLKCILEKVDKFGIRIEIGNVTLQGLGVGDKWLMLEFIRVGYSEKKLVRINRVRKDPLQYTGRVRKRT